MKKVLSILGDILVAAILIVAVTLTVAVITSSRNKDNITSLFGYAILSVQSNSMEGEKGFYVGDMIVIRMLDEEQASKLKVGDVITFRRTLGGKMYLDTHRIIANTPEVNALYDTYKNEIKDGVWNRGGVTYYLTQGDNTPAPDLIEGGTELEYTSPSKIVGQWFGIRIPKLGAIIDFMKSQLGFMICIVIPVALFFIYELYVFIVTLSRKKKEEAMAEVTDKEEELKKKAIEEFLAQQAAAAGASAEAKDGEAEEAAAEEKTEEKKKDKKKKKDKEEPKEEVKEEEVKEEAEEEEEEDEADEEEADEDEDEEEEKKEETKEEKSADEISEEEKQRIIQEYLAKQAAEAAEKAAETTEE